MILTQSLSIFTQSSSILSQFTIFFNLPSTICVNLLQFTFNSRSAFNSRSIHDRVLLQFRNRVMENLDGLGSTSTNSAVEDGLGSTSTGSTSINDGSIMNDLRNPGGSLFYTDSDSDSEPESENNAVEVSYLPDCPSQLKPYIGQIFLKIDDATEFYNKYARHVGFDTRKHGSKKKGDHVTWLYVVCSDIARLLEGDGDKIRAFRHIMAEGRKEVLGEGNVLSISDKRQMIESFYGSEVPSEIEVHPPDVVSTKGSGRRLSRLEKEIKEMSKPGRKCAKCGEVGRHDSRNCDKIQEEKKKKRRKNN